MSRSIQEECLERVRAYRDTESYRKALRKRVVWAEPRFAGTKEWHGLRRFRLRGLDKVNAEALQIASGQNVKRLQQFGGRCPEKIANCGPAPISKATPTPDVPTSHDLGGNFSTVIHDPCRVTPTP